MFSIEVNGRARRVDVIREPQRLTVMLDGERFAVDLRRTHDGWSLLLAGLPAESEAYPAVSRSHRVSFAGDFPGSGLVRVDGQPVGVVSGRARHGSPGGLPAPADSGSGAAPGALTVRAPMPGRVARVLVTAGEHVRARQGLVVVEAMKMENELRAPREGVVREVLVRAGASVDARAPLVVMD
ncbi:MAG: biotin/lipoyl-containing protein [Vicinamibacterales bacterium]